MSKLWILLFLCGVVGFTSAQNLPPKLMKTYGHGTVRSAPETLSFDIVIEQRGAVAAKLSHSVNELIQKQIQFLLEHKVLEKDIQALHATLSPWYDYANNQQVNKGFVFTRRIQVSLRELDAYPALMDGILARGASRFENMHFKLEDPDQLYIKALELAVMDAKHKANILARNVNKQIVEVVGVEELLGSQSTRALSRSAGLTQESASGFLPGEIALDARVEVLFALD